MENRRTSSPHLPLFLQGRNITGLNKQCNRALRLYCIFLCQHFLLFPQHSCIHPCLATLTVHLLPPITWYFCTEYFFYCIHKRSGGVMLYGPTKESMLDHSSLLNPPKLTLRHYAVQILLCTDFAGSLQCAAVCIIPLVNWLLKQ